ncbi:MAG: SLBB domain-containing protein [Pseudomonadota bacterium]
MNKTLEKIRNAGIVGAGGAGFPAFFKLNSKVEIVLANGSECEPCLSSDRVMMEEHFDKLVSGVLIAMDLTAAKKGIIALKDHYHLAKERLIRATKEIENIEICTLADFYPAGDEHTLVYEATKRIIPEGAIPLNVGVLVSNVTTLINLHDALKNDEVLIYKYVTVAGEVKTPGVYNVPIGTSFADLIMIAGGLKKTYRNAIDNIAIIDGGPMMGSVSALQNCVQKVTGGIIVVPKDHKLIQLKSITIDEQIKRARSACDQCTQCTEFCPRYLNGHRIKPHMVMRDSALSKTDTAESFFASFLCCFCGLCAVVCPCGLAPKNLYEAYKKEFINNQIRNPLTNKVDAVRINRDGKKFAISRLAQMLDVDKYNKHYAKIAYKFIPKYLKINLKPNFGNLLTPLVFEKNRVSKFEMLAIHKKDDAMAVPVHSPVDGVVEEVSEEYILIKNLYSI